MATKTAYNYEVTASKKTGVNRYKFPIQAKTFREAIVKAEEHINSDHDIIRIERRRKVM